MTLTSSARVPPSTWPGYIKFVGVLGPRPTHDGQHAKGSTVAVRLGNAIVKLAPQMVREAEPGRRFPARSATTQGDKQ